MSSEVIVALGQKTLEMAVLLAAPLLIVLAVSEPGDQRGADTDLAAGQQPSPACPGCWRRPWRSIVLMPWMLRKLAHLHHSVVRRLSTLDAVSAMDWNLDNTVLGMASVGMRISGLLLFAPFFGSDAIAPASRSGWSSPLTALLYPVCGRAGWS